VVAHDDRVLKLTLSAAERRDLVEYLRVSIVVLRLEATGWVRARGSTARAMET
jgi:hypothetical protein